MINRVQPRFGLVLMCLALSCAPAHAAGGDPSPIRIEIGYTADDNVNRAASAEHKLGDDIITAYVAQSMIFPVTDRTRAVVTGFLSAEKLRRLTALDRISLGVQGEFQFRPTGEFFAPTFGIVGRALLDEDNSDMRSGQRYSVGANMRQALTDRIQLFGALTANWRNAKSVIFDGRDYAGRFNLDYALDRDSTLYFGGEYRRGDIVTSAPDSDEYEAIAKFDAPDDAYGNRGFVAYRYEAKTVLWTLGYNRRLGPNDSIDVWWRRIESTPTASGPLGTLSYSANQYAISYLIRF